MKPTAPLRVAANQLRKLSRLCALRRNMPRFDREFCGFPAGDAAGNFADAGKSSALQQACRDRRSVAARTVNQQWTILRKFFQIFSQMIQRHSQAAGDVLLIALARRANVDKQRRLGL